MPQPNMERCDGSLVGVYPGIYILVQYPYPYFESSRTSEGVEQAPTPVKTINNLTGPRETRRRGGEHLQGGVFAEEQGRDGGGRSPLRSREGLKAGLAGAET